MRRIPWVVLQVFAAPWPLVPGLCRIRWVGGAFRSIPLRPAGNSSVSAKLGNGGNSPGRVYHQGNGICRRWVDLPELALTDTVPAIVVPDASVGVWFQLPFCLISTW